MDTPKCADECVCKPATLINLKFIPHTDHTLTSARALLLKVTVTVPDTIMYAESAQIFAQALSLNIMVKRHRIHGHLPKLSYSKS
jgi:hypothetical protein